MKLSTLLLASIVLLAGCAPGGVNSPDGFRLPAGNAEAGRKAFVDLRCYVCHTVKGVDAKYEGTPAAQVVLGGKVTRVKTYGELVTSVINPSHRIAPGYPAEQVAPGGKSLMATAGLNDVMTVTQLVDLVTFLQGTYNVEPPAFNPYAYRYYH